MAERADALIEALGGTRVVGKSGRRSADLRLVVRNGLPIKTVDAVMATYRVSKDTVMRTLGISESTMRRRKATGRLTAVESDRLYRLANAATQAEAVLGAREKAIAWLHTPNRALDGEAPFSMLDTDIGYSRVLDVLGRLEHGVYS